MARNESDQRKLVRVSMSKYILLSLVLMTGCAGHVDTEKAQYDQQLNQYRSMLDQRVASGELTPSEAEKLYLLKKRNLEGAYKESNIEWSGSSTPSYDPHGGGFSNRNTTLCSTSGGGSDVQTSLCF